VVLYRDAERAGPERSAVVSSAVRKGNKSQDKGREMKLVSVSPCEEIVMTSIYEKTAGTRFYMQSITKIYVRIFDSNYFNDRDRGIASSGSTFFGSLAWSSEKN
jgi:hypothetical protein